MDGSREAKKKKMLVALDFPRTLHFSSMFSIGWFLSQAGFFYFLFFWLLLVFIEALGLWLPHVWLSLVAARTSLVEHGF